MCELLEYDSHHDGGTGFPFIILACEFLYLEAHFDTKAKALGIYAFFQEPSVSSGIPRI